MKKLSLTDIKKAGKWVLPAGIVALGIASVVAGQPGTGGSKAAVTGVSTANSQNQATESPAPTVAPKISVNGAQIPTDKDGSTTMDIPGGKAQVNVSGGRTQVTTSNTTTNGDTSNKSSGNVNVDVNSQSHGGNSWGTTQVYGYNVSSDDSGVSSSSTSIFSTDTTGDVSISQ